MSTQKNTYDILINNRDKTPLVVAGLLANYQLSGDKKSLEAANELIAQLKAKKPSNGKELLDLFITYLFATRRLLDEELKEHLLTILRESTQIKDAEAYIVYKIAREVFYEELEIDPEDIFNSLSEDERKKAEKYIKDLETNAVYGWKWYGYDIERLPASFPKIEEDNIESVIDFLVYQLQEIESMLRIARIEEELKILKIGNNAIFGRRTDVLKGFMFIGRIIEGGLEKGKYFNLRAMMDGAKPHVVLICGQRGSGKSYTMGVIAEELAKIKIGIGVVIIDPIGIYWSMKYPNKEKRELELLKQWNLEPRGFDIRLFIPIGFFDKVPDPDKIPFSITPSDLTVDDWCYIFDIDRFGVQGMLLETAIEFVKNGYTAGGIKRPKKEQYTIKDLVKCIEEADEILSKEKGFKKETRRALITRLLSAEKWGIFSEKGTPLEELIKEDIPTVIDVSFLQENVRALVVGILARKIFEARQKLVRQIEAGGAETTLAEIPPTWLLVDEAHLFVPSGRKTVATNPILDYVKLGRKPGCSIVLCTQQPSATDDRVLSQVDIVIAHSLALESDIVALNKRVPAHLAKEMDEHFFRSLRRGMAVVADGSGAASRAFLVQIRPRQSQHAGREALAKAFEQVKIVEKKAKEIKKEVPKKPEKAQVPPVPAVAIPINVSEFPPSTIATKLTYAAYSLLDFEPSVMWKLLQEPPEKVAQAVSSKLKDSGETVKYDSLNLYRTKSMLVGVFKIYDETLLFIAGRGNLATFFEGFKEAPPKRIYKKEITYSPDQIRKLLEAPKKAEEVPKKIEAPSKEPITPEKIIEEAPKKEIPKEKAVLEKEKIKMEINRLLDKMETIVHGIKSLDAYYKLRKISKSEYIELRTKAIAKVKELKRKLEELRAQLKR